MNKKNHQNTNPVYQKHYLEKLITYKEYQHTLGYTSNTCKRRYNYLKQFFSWLEKQNIYYLHHVQTQDIYQYKTYLESLKSKRTQEPLCIETRNERLRLVQTYFGYALEQGLIQTNPASSMVYYYSKIPTERIIFTLEQIQELYQVAHDPQDKLLLHLAYGCGLRVNEIVELTQKDLKYKDKKIIVNQGKNNKRRVVPINDKVAQEIKAYLRQPLYQYQQALFINKEGRAMKAWSFNNNLKKLLKQTNFGKQLPETSIKKIGIHTLRHSIATHLIENGMKLEQVQTFLGHSRLESTEVYTHISSEQLKNIKR